jgi:putative ABC transport system permease protein
MYIYIAIRINPKNMDGTLDYIRTSWKNIIPGVSLSYTYLEDAYNNLYNPEKKTGQLLTIFTVLALFISCLGLFGFASFIVTGRIKEVGIRKVMGARLSGISALLSKEFILWIMASSLVACPVAYILAAKWLQNFAFHIEPGWWVFILAVLFELMIAIFTVSWLIWRTATKNPVEALRYE